jgi:hypothetical protein
MRRICRLLLSLTVLGKSGFAADVTAYVTAQGTTLTYPAKALAKSLFEEAGVIIDWESGKLPHNQIPATWLWIELAERTPRDLLPGALARAYPYAGCSKRITVFIDRVRDLARAPDREASLLAYVMVHEITHVLQGVERHSDEGVMKGNWSARDRSEIFARKLKFAEEDLIILRHGLTVWARSQQGFNVRFEGGNASHPD